VRFLDDPSGNSLKIHSTPIPILGGMAIMLGILFSSVFAFVRFVSIRSDLLTILIALCFIFLTGLWDDKKGLKPSFRLLAQFLVATLFIMRYEPGQNWLASFLLIFIIVLCINALNFLDGIDGLASGITLVASGGFLVGFLFLENDLGLVIALIVIGSSLGFLFFNFNPAKIFLGDNGSTVFGFLLGVLFVLFITSTKSIYETMFPILVLIIPIAEVILVVFRRTKNHDSLFRGDRNHSYDILIKKGFTQKQTTLLFCFIGLLSSVVGLFFLIH
jgi:UDP-GlcNAc:undecaprenyl-phosphate GlcNAc-1-phosphate transferase